MTESERAIVRACLDQTVLALEEAGGVQPWWGTLSMDNRDKFREFLALIKGLRMNLDIVKEIRHL